MKDFIPKPYKKDAVTIRFEHTTIEKLEQISSQYGLSRNELVVQCVEYALQNLSDLALRTDETE